jgi:phenylacetate-CoA ligase
MRTRHQRHGKHFYEILRFLKESEWWSQEQICDFQDRKLQQIVHHAYESVPYYRQVFDGLGLHPQDIRSQQDLSKLPILTKDDVQRNYEELISRRFKRRDLHINLTSGTTGKPLAIYLTHEALQFQWAVWWRHRARFGLKFGDWFLMFGARLPVSIKQTKPPYWRYDYALNRVYLSTYHLTPSTIPEVVKWLNQQHFDFFTGYPSAMYALASFMQDNGLRLLNRPKYVVTGAETLIPAFEHTIRDVFGAPVTEQYGNAEACGNFAKCEYGRFHLDAEFCIVELLPIPELDRPDMRRLIFTGLANPAMPLIRYDIGDYGRLAKGPCPCGRETLTLESIDGRIEDFVRTPDGRMAIGMNQVFEWASGVREAQIVQNQLDKIEVRVVPGPGYSEQDKKILESELQKRLGHDMQIEFRIVDSIPRAANGKFRAVLSNIEGKSSGEQVLQQTIRNSIW